jgi:hypothetical protein
MMQKNVYGIILVGTLKDVFTNDMGLVWCNFQAKFLYQIFDKDDIYPKWR